MYSDAEKTEAPQNLPRDDSWPNRAGATARLGSRMLDAGVITPGQLQQALEVQARSQAFLGQVLVDLGFVNAATIGRELETTSGVRYVDLLTYPPDPQAVSLVPEQILRETQAIPLRIVGESLEVAMVDPLDVAAIDRLYLVTGRRVIPRLSMAWELQRAINDHFDAYVRASAALQELESQAQEVEAPRKPASEVAGASTAPIVRLVDALVEGALALRASDIHFEPQEGGLRVRYRVDGTLMDHATIPRGQQTALVARLKVLCRMDITESRRPQDGRMSYDQNGRLFDLRVSAVPTVYGEKLVLRILDKTSVIFPLARLGLSMAQQEAFEFLIRRPHGMVIVVGPTGSGKTTTLYSAVNLLNDLTRNIVTLEDPVEYYVTGLNQVQVNPRIGLTFASGLRALVRQDPDVILVGEIRDQETAEMATQASLTGHLLLSTLHTNSGVGTISRLDNLGVDRFLIAQSLSGIVSQRLVARICRHCAAEYQPAQAVLTAVGITAEEAKGIQFKRGRGCRTCHGRGFLGRYGIFEVIVMNDELLEGILENVPEAELQKAASRAGFRSLRDAALDAVRSGNTTPEEMGRVVLMKGS